MYCPFIAVSSNSGYLILTLPFVTRNTSYSVEILSCDIRNLEMCIRDSDLSGLNNSLSQVNITTITPKT